MLGIKSKFDGLQKIHMVKGSVFNWKNVMKCEKHIKQKTFI